MPKITLRRRILTKRGIELEKHTRRPKPIDEVAAPYHKTNLMKYMELKHKTHIHKLIRGGTIYEVGKRLGLNPSTISKWRKQIKEQLTVRGGSR